MGSEGLLPPRHGTPLRARNRYSFRQRPAGHNHLTVIQVVAQLPVEGETVGVDPEGHYGLVRIDGIDDLAKFRPGIQSGLQRLAPLEHDRLEFPGADVAAIAGVRIGQGPTAERLDGVALAFENVTQPESAGRPGGVADFPAVAE